MQGIISTICELCGPQPLTPIFLTKPSSLQVDVVIDELGPTYTVDFPYNPITYNLTAFKIAYNLTDADPADFPFLANDAVFSITKALSGPYGVNSYGYDWFEGFLAYIDLVRGNRRLALFLWAIITTKYSNFDCFEGYLT